MYLETPESIYNWGVETFGHVKWRMVLLSRTNEEVAELLSKLFMSAPASAVLEEAADCGVMIAQSAWMSTFDITQSSADWSRSRVRKAIPTTLGLIVQEEFCQHMRDVHLNEGGREWAIVRLTECWVALEELCYILGSNLRTEIDKKMKINRARQWRVDANGRGQHV